MPSILVQRALGYSSPGDPGSVQEQAWKEKNLKKALAISTVKTLWVHKSVVVQFNALNLFLNRAMDAGLGEKIDDWGFANRDIRGFSGIKSYHAFALAEDLDATEHPLGQRQTTFADNQKERELIRKVCSLLGMRWGFDYENRPDPMHFEHVFSRARARFIRSRLIKPTKRSRKLAELCKMDVADFCKRVRQVGDF
jgi:hypothetical protein